MFKETILYGGVTTVGVTRGGNWWVSPHFFLQKFHDLF